MVGIVSGSGIELRTLLDDVCRERPFSAFEGLACGSVAGHAGVIIEGSCNGVPVVLQQGRLHSYEGLSFQAVTATVDVLRGLGVRRIIFTNAVGGLLPEMQPGDLVAADRVRTWPFQPFRLPKEIRPDLLAPGCGHTGPYHWMHGPCYETCAEIAALQRLGSATVGMSTAPEMARCRELRIEAALVSCVTNSCVRPVHLTHQHVMETAQRASAHLSAVIRNTLPALASPPGA